MSEGSSRLPDRPSLEQLKKQAKDLLRAWRNGEKAALDRVSAHQPDATEITLADTQFVIAREYHFPSWPRLAHYVAAHVPRGTDLFEALARDLVTALDEGDVALGRLDRSLTKGRTAADLRKAISRASGPGEDGPGGVTLARARDFIAQAFGFDSWDRLRDTTALPPADPRTASAGLSTRPPFYRIDWTTNTLEPRQPLTDGDWATLIDVIREHGITGLNANGHMTDRALDRVARVEHLTRLQLGGSKHVTDDGLLQLARMPQIQALDVTGTGITDRGLTVLQHLAALRSFQMCWQHGVTDDGVAHLSGCHQIARVDLLGSPVGDAAIAALAGKRHMRHLKTGRFVTDAGLRLLRDVPAFRTWQGGPTRYDLMSFGDTDPNFLMLDGPFTDAGMASVAGLEGLFGLGFFWHASALTSDGLRSLRELPHLGALACESRLCDDAAMRHIAAIPALRMLMAQGTVATDAGFAALSRSSTVEYLWGRECPNLGGRGFAALAAMPALRGLAVSCRRVDDAALSALPAFPALRWLVPMDVADAGFRHVGRCRRLEKLTCMYCRNTGDEATRHIASLPALTHYYAGQTLITDRSLEILGRMESLEEIVLSACAGVSDAGLAALAALPRLRTLALDASPRVSRAGLAVFRPDVHVDFWT